MIAIFPKTVEYAVTGDIEKLVCVTREYFGGKRAYSARIDLEDIFKSVGINIETISYHSRGALVAKDQKGTFKIASVINQDVHDPRERKFLLAHLLGHYFLHIQPKIAGGDLAIQGIREDTSPMLRYGQGTFQKHHLSKTEQQDAEADNFAAALLMPLGFIKRSLERTTDTNKLAQLFDLPIPVLTRRMESLGLWTDDTHKSLLPKDALSIDNSDQPNKFSSPLNTSQTSRNMQTPHNLNRVNQILAATGYSQEKNHTNSTPNNSPRKDPIAPKIPASPHQRESSLKNNDVSIESTTRKNLSGMERIRQIAKMLDPSV